RANTGTRWKGDCPLRVDFIHDVPDGAHATPAGGGASEAPVDLAGGADGLFGGNGPDLAVRNDIARTHNHDPHSRPDRYDGPRMPRFAALSATACRLSRNVRCGKCHFVVQRGKYYEMKSL